MTMAFTGPSTFTQALNLTPSSLACSGSPLLCRFAIALEPGSYTATVATFDQAPVGGSIPAGANLLSLARNVPFPVTLGDANRITLSLDGVPASLVVDGFPPAADGTAFSAPKKLSR